MEFHDHVTRRMEAHWVSADEIVFVLANGWPCGDAHPGAGCRTCVSEFNGHRGRRRYADKEVTVYFKEPLADGILLTVKARDGEGFPRGTAE